MFVAISGSQGAGKSSIIKELKTNTAFNIVARKTSRSILSDWQVTLDEINADHVLTMKFQDEIIKRKYDDELAARISDKVWFTERTYADLFTYAMFALGGRNDCSDWLDAYYKRCMHMQQSYDHVYYLKAGHFAPANDGVRAANTHYSRAVDLAMDDITSQMTMPAKYSAIDTPLLSQRVAIISTQISSAARKMCSREYQNDGK